MLLEGKTAVIYGAGGGIGRGVAPAFAREGARVVLAGRTRAPLEAVAAEVAAAGGEAEVAEVDALDEAAVDAHLDGVLERHGRLDVAFNLVARGDVQGAPLVDMPVDDILRPVETGLRANVVTARAAARRMAETGGGVIMTVTSGSGTDAATRQASAGGFHMGGTGPADAAVEAFLRYLAAEMGPRGVRVLGIWTAGVPESFAARRSAEEAETAHGMSVAEIEAAIASMASLRRAPNLPLVADAAAFLASDRAGLITGTMINVSAGLIAD
jgi:NAD(P)-dependent dehydrogenase (short-subunit alcohol dehydrogenase family)